MTLWWDRWCKQEEKTHGIEIELWDETELVALLISPDAEHVRGHYYGGDTVLGSAEALPVRRRRSQKRYDHALFVRQMREAGHVEIASCKEQFFNAEIVAREIHDKGVAEEEQALVTADAHVHAIWEARFAEACERNVGGLLPGLHRSVMGDVRAERAALPSVLRLGPLHAMGLAHRTVEDGRAGWVRDFRRVAAEHRAGSSDRGETLEQGRTCGDIGDVTLTPSGRRGEYSLKITSAFRLGQLLLLLRTLLGHRSRRNTSGAARYYDFFAANPHLLVAPDDPAHGRLLMAGFDPSSLSYASPGQRFSSRRERLQHDLALLVSYGLAAVSQTPGRLTYAITDDGQRLAEEFTALYARAYAASAETVIGRLRRLSDSRLREESRTWLRAPAALLDLIDRTPWEEADA